MAKLTLNRLIVEQGEAAIDPVTVGRHQHDCFGASRLHAPSQLFHCGTSCQGFLAVRVFKFWDNHAAVRGNAGKYKVTHVSSTENIDQANVWHVLSMIPRSRTHVKCFVHSWTMDTATQMGGGGYLVGVDRPKAVYEGSSMPRTMSSILARATGRKAMAGRWKISQS